MAQLYVIEGGDAVGKETQAAMLAKEFSCKTISFPRYETPAGQIIRKLLQEEIELDAPNVHMADGFIKARMLQALMFYDRFTCLELRRPGHYILNRYWQSGFAYGGFDGIPDEELLEAAKGLPVGKVNILLTLPVEQQIARIRARGRSDQYENLPAEKLAIIQQRYVTLWWEYGPNIWPEAIWLEIDASGTPEQVHERIRRAIRVKEHETETTRW